MPHTSWRPVSLVFAAAIACLAFTACAPQPSPSLSPSGSQSGSPAPSVTSSAPPSAVGTPINIGCDQLISSQDMYDYNSNYSLQDENPPVPGSTADTIAGLNGLTCGWINQTSGTTIDVAAANLPAAEFTKEQNGVAARSTSTTAYGGTGYFSLVNGVGEANEFTGSLWVSASSPDFAAAGDAQPVIAAALKGLGH